MERTQAETQIRTWDSLIEFLVASGLQAGEIMDAVHRYKQAPRSRTPQMTDNELSILRRLLWEIQGQVGCGQGTELELKMRLSFPEVLDLRSINRKLMDTARGMDSAEGHAECDFS